MITRTCHFEHISVQLMEIGEAADVVEKLKVMGGRGRVPMMGRGSLRGLLP
jgi:hypothetical protein